MKYQLKKDIIIPKGTIFEIPDEGKTPAEYNVLVGTAVVKVEKSLNAAIGLGLSGSNKADVNKWIKPLA